MLQLVLLSVLVASSAAITIQPLGSGGSGPAIQGITECGSAGQILAIRVTNCQVPPCVLKVGDTLTVEADFKPARSHSSLTVNVEIDKDGGNIPYKTESVSANIEQGQSYTISLPLDVTGKFGTGNMNIKIEASDSGMTELCGMAGAIIN